MDEVKKILRGISRYSFWIICFGVSAAAIAMSILSAQTMNTARAKYESEINSDLAKIEKIKSTKADLSNDSVKAHPNRFTKEGMEKQIEIAATEAVDAWTLRYNSQAPAYVWPEDLLGPFTNVFRSTSIPERLKVTGQLVSPAEAAASTADPETGPEVTANSQELEKFAQVINKRLPQISEIISATWNIENEASAESQPDVDSEGVGSNLQGRGQSAESRSGDGSKIQKNVVDWSAANQIYWNDKVTNFKMSRSAGNRPTLPMALFIQQDLWLLEALFKVIKEVNGDADAMDNADIRKIDHIYFGQYAMGMLGEIRTPNSRLRKEAEDLGHKREIPQPPRAKVPPQPPQTKIAFSPTSRDFLNGRYVNGKFEPLSAETVRTAIGTNKLSNNAELTVAKRVPFRIAFEMDERRIPEFLAACANSSFRFEVRQLRINRHSPGQTMLPDGKDFGSSAQAASDETGSSSGTSRRTATKDDRMIATRTNYFVKVEFYGVVKIYNPVNLDLFKNSTPATKQTAAK